MILTRSFMAAEDMSDSSVVLFPKHLSLDTLSLAAGMLDYGKSLATTLAVVLTVTGLQTFVCLMVGSWSDIYEAAELCRGKERLAFDRFHTPSYP